MNWPIWIIIAFLVAGFSVVIERLNEITSILKDKLGDTNNNLEKILENLESRKI